MSPGTAIWSSRSSLGPLTGLLCFSHDTQVPVFIFIIVIFCHSVSMSTSNLGFLGGLDGRESASDVEDLGSIPGSERSPGGGNGNPLQYSCLENPTDRGAWRTAVHGVAKSQTRLSD